MQQLKTVLFVLALAVLLSLGHGGGCFTCPARCRQHGARFLNRTEVYEVVKALINVGYQEIKVRFCSCFLNFCQFRIVKNPD